MARRKKLTTAFDDTRQIENGQPAEPKKKPRIKRTKPDQVEAAPPTACRKCGSTDRDPYYGTITRHIYGIDRHTGQVYTHVVWRRTRCRGCGQQRIDRTREHRTGD